MADTIQKELKLNNNNNNNGKWAQQFLVTFLIAGLTAMGAVLVLGNRMDVMEATSAQLSIQNRKLVEEVTRLIAEVKSDREFTAYRMGQIEKEINGVEVELKTVKGRVRNVEGNRHRRNSVNGNHRLPHH